MRKYEDSTRLGHIFDAICTIEKYVSGVDKPAFLANGMMQDAVMRQIKLLGK
jgi:uncharacterized protein with HEPN domain